MTRLLRRLMYQHQHRQQSHKSQHLSRRKSRRARFKPLPTRRPSLLKQAQGRVQNLPLNKTYRPLQLGTRKQAYIHARFSPSCLGIIAHLVCHYQHVRKTTYSRNRETQQQAQAPRRILEAHQKNCQRLQLTQQLLRPSQNPQPKLQQALRDQTHRIRLLPFKMIQAAGRHMQARAVMLRTPQSATRPELRLTRSPHLRPAVHAMTPQLHRLPEAQVKAQTPPGHPRVVPLHSQRNHRHKNPSSNRCTSVFSSLKATAPLACSTLKSSHGSCATPLARSRNARSPLPPTFFPTSTAQSWASCKVSVKLTINCGKAQSSS